MAQVIEVKTARGAGMMLRGKLGNQVFQVRNGKQVVAKMPKERTTPPSEKEIEHRQRFATLTQAINRLTPEQWSGCGGNGSPTGINTRARRTARCGGMLLRG